MKALTEIIIDSVGYWLWLAGFTAILAIIGLALNTELGWTLGTLFIIALAGKITYGIIKH